METSRIHNFASGINANTCLGSGPGGSQLRADLFWSDPLGASTNDYDLYVLNSSGTTVIASSLNPQNGSQDPYESVGTISNGELIVIVKFSGAGRFLHLSTGRGLLSVSTQGSTRGHDCATNAFGVAATGANNSYPFAFTGGAANPVETFSSDGPRRVFFQANGTPITPGNFSSTGGAVRQKPDITAADNVTTDVPGFAPFPGTSAAAPHAAAIAALLKSSSPNLIPTQIRGILTGTALDIMSAGADRDSGAGIVMALAALQAAPHPDLTRRTDSLNNTSPHTGDVVTASITITNQSCSGGSANAGAFHVGFYWSTDPTFSGITPFYEAPIGSCLASGTVPLNQNITIAAQNTPGTYYLGYKINDEAEVSECNENNNGIFYWTITVLPPPQPDLTGLTGLLNNSSPHAGDAVKATITITNQSCSGGSANAGAFHVGFYWSTSSSFSGVSPFYEAPVSGCASNGTVSLTNNITIGAGNVPGTYYLGYKINDENEVAECNGGNNGIYYWTVTVIPDTTPPSVSITNPPSAKTYTNAQTVTISVTATDNVGVVNVEFYDGFTLKGTDTTPPYTYDWSFTAADNGSNVWTARAYDAAGNVSTSSAVTLTVSIDITPPTVVISSPTNGQVLTTSPFTVTGTAADPGSPTSGVSVVQVRLNGGSWSNATGTASWTRSVTLSPCPNTIEARSLDNAGNYSSIASNFVTYIPPNTPPNTPSNISPPNAATNVSVTPTLQASAFSDVDCIGDTHAASQWQVLNSAGAIVVADSGTDTVNKVSWLVPAAKLYYGSNYQWRVRYQDSRSGWSSNSAQTTFTTGGPLLSGAKQGTNIIFKWPTNALGFSLQWVTNLGLVNWSNATPLPVIVSGQYTITNSMTNNARFYRLKK